MIPIQARLTTATFVLAQQCARNAVKEELKRQRVRIADVEAKEITERAQAGRAKDMARTYLKIV
jgi:hypothetical protein